MSRPAARITDPTVHGTPLLPGPGSFDVMIGFPPAWRGVPAGAAQALQKEKAAADILLLAAKNAVKAALATGSGVAAARVAEETLKWELAAKLGTEFTALAAGADIHLCPVPLPAPPHGSGVVIDGSPTVLINNLPACRMGDTVLEALGGTNKIALGFPTVIIGDGPGASPFGMSKLDLLLKIIEMVINKDARKAFLQSLVAALKAMAIDAALGSVERRLSAFLADKTHLSDQQLKAAAMSNLAYSDPDQWPPGWQDAIGQRLATPAELAALGLTGSNPIVNDDSGFRSVVFVDPDGNYTVAMAGTSMDLFNDPAGFFNDWATNFMQNAGLETDQYNQAENIAQTIQSHAPDANVSYTGHSLGGGLASVAALESGNPATTFNAAGLNPSTYGNLDAPTVAANQQNITNITTTGDVLTNIQNSPASGAPQGTGTEVTIPSTTDGVTFGGVLGHAIDQFPSALDRP